LSRRNDGSLKTLLKGAHGRAIQGVCSYLTRDAADEMVDRMQLGEKRLAEQFQMVFQVSLTYDPRSKVSGPTSVKLVKWACGKDVRSIDKASGAHS
jgi:hypothetical protein